MIVSSFDGSPRPVTAYLTTTSAATIYTAPAGCVATLESLYVCNKTAGAVTFTLTVTDGTTTWTIYNVGSIAANGTLERVNMGITMREGWALKATANTMNALDIVASVIELPKTRAA